MVCAGASEVKPSKRHVDMGAELRRCVAHNVYDPRMGAACDQHNAFLGFNRKDTSFLEAEMVIEAIGQGADTSYIPKELADRLEYEGRRIKLSEQFQSSVPWLFVGGDIAQGPDVIHAIYNGREAVEGIDAYIKGRT